MPTTKQLSLEWKLRQGGGGKTERRYLDFMIDGISIYDASEMGDTIGCLGWMPPAAEIAEIDKLLLEQPNPYGDAYLLYVCPECGHISCGAVATTITMTSILVLAPELIHRIADYVSLHRS